MYSRETTEVYLSTYAECGTSSLHLLQKLSEVLQQNPRLHSPGISMHHSFAHSSTNIKEKPNKEHQSISTNKQIIIYSYSKFCQRKNSAQKVSLHCWLTLSLRLGQLFCACDHIMPLGPSQVYSFNVLIFHCNMNKWEPYALSCISLKK